MDPAASADDYYLYGLSDLVSNGKFIDELKAISKAEEERIAEEENQDEDDQKKSKETKGFDKIVLVDPYFVYYSTNDNENYEKAEQDKI
ncbi:MAG: hypothetical protein IT222_13415 [Crocinitomix sp.]|nr:hypothetical protein [Crocinitomix sp.]